MSRAKGDQAEARACTYLQERGVQILARNVYNRYGEIDIIALHEGVVHFIEVKSAQTHAVALANLTSHKLSKLTRAIACYLQAHSYEGPYCLDALIICEDAPIAWIENITL